MNHLDKETREKYERELTKHYGEPLLTPSEVNKRLGKYVDALTQAYEDGDYTQNRSPFSAEATEAIVRHGHHALVFAWKSNLLFRLFYLGEGLRTEKCPEHEGRWSGCHFFHDGPHACQCGYDVTGWLPNERTGN